MKRRPATDQLFSIFFLILIVVVLIFIDKNFLFDENRVICPHRILFGVECPFCGITRASYHVLHFDFRSAFISNPVIYLFVLYLFSSIISIWLNTKILQVLKKILFYITILAFIVLYAYRIYVFV